MDKCKSTEKGLKNGVWYMARETTHEDDGKHNFGTSAVTDEYEEIGECFIVTADDLGKKMRLFHEAAFRTCQY